MLNNDCVCYFMYLLESENDQIPVWTGGDVPFVFAQNLTLRSPVQKMIRS